MYTSFGPGALGIDLSFPEVAALAADVGFGGIQVDMAFLQAYGPDDYRAVLAEHDLRSGSLSLPVDVAGDPDSFETDLASLPEIAADAAAIGCSRTSTYVLSFSDELPFEENFKFHRDRLGRVADVLAEHDMRLGLEFLGPQTLREGHAYEFVHTVEGMVDLADAAGENVGLLLDAWHWHTAGGSVAALESLGTDDIVDVHVNDAPLDVSLAEYVDSERAIPGETGVVDIEAFLGHLDAIDYEGPVMVEPFSDELNAMDPEPAARRTMDSLETIWEQAGI